MRKCSKITVQLHLKSNAVPVHYQARPVALVIQDQVNAELDRLINNGTLVPVDSSTWASPIVIAKKYNGKLRVCADFLTGLNNALVDVNYPIANMEEVITGNKIFSQLDLSDAYYQLPLNESSQELTTINTHRGLLRYTRLVFGLKPAFAIFQKTLEQTLDGINE